MTRKSLSVWGAFNVTFIVMAFAAVHNDALHTLATVLLGSYLVLSGVLIGVLILMFLLANEPSEVSYSPRPSLLVWGSRIIDVLLVYYLASNDLVALTVMMGFLMVISEISRAIIRAMVDKGLLVPLSTTGVSP